MTTADRPNLRIDPDRLWSSLMELGQIGGTEKGGVCRIALTDLDRQRPRPVRALGQGGGLHHQGRPARQCLRPPRGPRSGEGRRS